MRSALFSSSQQELHQLASSGGRQPLGTSQDPRGAGPQQLEQLAEECEQTSRQLHSVGCSDAAQLRQQQHFPYSRVSAVKHFLNSGDGHFRNYPDSGDSHLNNYPHSRDNHLRNYPDSRSGRQAPYPRGGGQLPTCNSPDSIIDHIHHLPDSQERQKQLHYLQPRRTRGGHREKSETAGANRSQPDKFYWSNYKVRFSSSG